MSASNKFKLRLANMHPEEVLNFIWIYDQYVCSLKSDEYPVNIEEFYHRLYKKEFKYIKK